MRVRLVMLVEEMVVAVGDGVVWVGSGGGVGTVGATILLEVVDVPCDAEGAGPGSWLGSVGVEALELVVMQEGDQDELLANWSARVSARLRVDLAMGLAVCR